MPEPRAPAMARHVPLLLFGLVAALLVAAPATAALSAPAAHAAILVCFTIAAWAFGWFAEPIASFMFFLLAAVFHIAPPTAVFAGFASAAWWLVLGGSITAIAVDATGLGKRLAGLLFGTKTLTYRGAVVAVAATAVALAFVMPSTAARIILLTPIVLGLADRLGLGPGNVGRRGLVMTLAASSYMPPTTILPANVPNAVLFGSSEALYGIKLTYGPYLLLHFPVLGALKAVILVALVWRLFPVTGASDSATAPAPRGALSRSERMLAVILAVSLLLFVTDFAHGVSPAWIALGAGLVCLLPSVGLVTPKMFGERTSLSVLIYVAAFLGVGAVIADSGLGVVLSRTLLRWADVEPHDGTTLNLVKLAVIGAGLGLLTTLSGLPAVLTPLAQDFATASGLPLYAVLMLQVVVFSTVFLPYQAPPMMIGMQLGGASIRDGTRLCVPLAAITILVLLPLDWLWWRVLGYA